MGEKRLRNTTLSSILKNFQKKTNPCPAGQRVTYLEALSRALFQHTDSLISSAPKAFWQLYDSSDQRKQMQEAHLSPQPKWGPLGGKAPGRLTAQFLGLTRGGARNPRALEQYALFPGNYSKGFVIKLTNI